MTDIAEISPRELGAMLYHLHFPNKEFGKLEAHVQASYMNDAERLQQMIKERT